MSVDVSRDGRGVLTVTLNRPEKRNAIDDEMMRALLDVVDRAATDDELRVIVLTGAGDDFCTGADIVARNTGDGDRRPRPGSIQRRLPTQSHRLIPALCALQLPVVCKARGWVAGLGFQLALAADFTIAADDARFAEPFGTRGFTPDSGATWLLPRRIGEIRAREVLLLGRQLSGAEAAEWGAIHEAVRSSELDAAADDIADRLVAAPTVALGLAKWLLHEGANASLEQQLANEAFAMELSSRSQDFREGLAAFREKRAPRFEGR